MVCARLQVELTTCKAEHASQLHAIRMRAEAFLRSLEIRLNEEALGKRLKNAETLHTQVVETLHNTIAKHEAAHHELVAKVDDSDNGRKTMATHVLELTDVEKAWALRCKNLQGTIEDAQDRGGRELANRGRNDPSTSQDIGGARSRTGDYQLGVIQSGCLVG